MYTGTAGSEYFAHIQKSSAPDAQKYAARVFLPYVSPSMRVLDFGCGNGEILSSLPCAEKIGIEINGLPASQARAKGITVHESLESVAAETVDAIISHHCLEHISDPHAKLGELRDKLRPEGRLIIAVPCELPFRRYSRDWSRPSLDVHLFSWNPRTLAALVKDCGFTVERVQIMSTGLSRYNKWLMPVPLLFWIAEKMFAHVLGRFQLLCIAHK